MGGMQGVNLTILTEASKMAYAGHPSFVIDFLGNRGNPNKDSLMGMGIKTNIALDLLQNLPGVSPTNTIVIANSFGTTAATIATMPEILSRSPKTSLPKHMILSDPFANMITRNWKSAPFFEIQKTYIWGQEDEMVDHSAYEALLEAAGGANQATHICHHGVHDAHMMHADTLGQKGVAHTVGTISAFGALTIYVTPDMQKVRDFVTTIQGEPSQESLMPFFPKLTVSLTSTSLEAFRQSVLAQKNPEKIKKLANILNIPTDNPNEIKNLLEAYVVKGPLEIDPQKAIGLTGLLKQGITFGPSSTEHATTLRQQRHDLAIGVFTADF